MIPCWVADWFQPTRLLEYGRQSAGTKPAKSPSFDFWSGLVGCCDKVQQVSLATDDGSTGLRGKYRIDKHPKAPDLDIIVDTARTDQPTIV